MARPPARRGSAALRIEPEPAPKHIAKVDASKRIFELTVAEFAALNAEVVEDRLVEFLEGAIRPPLEWMSKSECAEHMRVSSGTVDLLVKRDVDPLPFSTVGDHKKFHRETTNEWVRRQRKVGE